MERIVIPDWLQETKDKITESNEWRDLSSELFTAVQQQLKEHKVLFYTDLMDEEKAVVMDRASALIRHGDNYKALNRRVSSVLDRQLNCHSNKMTENEKKTKTEKLLEFAAEGSAALLCRWPDQKSRVRVCFNREFPPVLRAEVWKLCLSCRRYATEYLDNVKRNRIETVSSRDLEIGQKCEAILKSRDSKRYGVLSANPVFVTTMKSVLSWYHLKRGGVELSEPDYMLSIPLVSAVLEVSGIGAEDAVSDNVISVIIEMYLLLLEKRTKAMLDLSDQENKVASNSMAQRVEALVNGIDSQFCLSLQSALVVSSTPVQSTTDANQEQVPFYKRLRNLLHPVVRRLFVGYLSMEVVCFVWDQLVIVIDGPLDDCLAYLCATLLLLLKNSIQQCQSRQAVEHVLLTHSSKLTIRQFQRLLDDCFIKDLQQLLQLQISQSTAPVVDSLAAIGMPPPWEYWSLHTDTKSTDVIYDRQMRRQQRDEEHQRLMVAKREQEEARRKEQLEKQQQLEDEKRRTARELQQKEEETRILEERLEQEKLLRLKAEEERQQQRDELERLRQLWLQELAALSPRRHSETPNQQHQSVQPQNSPELSADVSEHLTGRQDSPLGPHLTTEQINSVLTDTLQRVMQAVNRLTHGSVNTT